MLPREHVAVQLVAPEELRLNARKPMPQPGPTQILARVECVGLCFSDMKLLHQFDRHPRKTPVLAHLNEAILREIPSYVPDQAPTVPGHEVVVRVMAVGDQVRTVRVGDRYLVQSDYRDLKTGGSNGAFGYNFEGGLQQYVLFDERVTVSAAGDSYLIPVPADRAASQLALVEPWACVEDAFATRERQSLKPGGRLLVIGDGDLSGIDASHSQRIDPATLASIAPRSIDDLLYAGADPDLLAGLLPLLANGGLLLIATGGARFGRLMSVPVGRVHYGGIRIAATTSRRFADALASIPASGELRPGDHVNVVGAGGPMGVMAMVRAVAASTPGALVEGGVRSPERAAALRHRVATFAEARGVRTRLFNPDAEPPQGPVDYCFLMAPVPELVQRAIADAAPRGIINVFAGISAETPCVIDLDQVAQKQLYFIGTSGSTLDDMRVVLGKVVRGELDTNLSVGAVSGMRGAIDGLHAVQNRTIAGKIIVYPQLPDLPLLELDALIERYPTLRDKLDDGCWSQAAEAELLRVAGQ